MISDILRDPLKEIPNRWVVRPDYMTLPQEPPTHLVEELLDIIDMVGDNPSEEHLKGMQRVARAIREEAK